MSEQVIKRDEYKVGMKVRLRNGDTDVLGVVERGNELENFPLQSSLAAWRRDGSWALCAGRVHGFDIIGEVVANTAATEVATKTVKFTTTEERLYDDGMCVHDGMVGTLSMSDLLELRRYYDRAISRLKATAKHYGWEV